MAYIKEIFDVQTFDQAKHVVLTSDPNDPKKFERETNFLIDTIIDEKLIDENSTVLDFGCGMGRISRELVHKIRCNVIGVDISESMLTFAKLYVASLNKFTSLLEYNQKETIDLCISAFVLQHVENPEDEIKNIHNVLKPNGHLVLLNEKTRYVPSDVNQLDNGIIWKDDNFNVFHECEKYFERIKSISYMGKPNQEIIFYRKSL
jgi:2-polyprenyl-3-methyl-5-hydroxy-6-metoxy-1,4-benzoquinol methylase